MLADGIAISDPCQVNYVDRLADLETSSEYRGPGAEIWYAEVDLRGAREVTRWGCCGELC
jgi:hypothetical protein